MAQKIVLTFILFLAFLLRTYRLDLIPVHLSNDEISIAYDSYSVLNTKKDEYGIFLPLSFKSHGTYKAPLYAYLNMPFIWLLGNNEYGVRTLSAVAGTLTVLLIYLIVTGMGGSKQLALLAAVILATNPWHIYDSRMALEANVALTFLAAGIWLYLKGLPIVSALMLALSVYGYHTEWLLVPILAFVLTLIYRKKNLVLFLISLAIFCLPIFWDYVSNLGTTARANTELLTKNIQVEAALKATNNPLKKVSIVGFAFLGNYSEYTDFSSLFVEGLGIFKPQHPYRQALFLGITFPFLILGIPAGLRELKKKDFLFLIIWALVSPVVPAMTQGGVNQVRNLVTVLPYVIFIALGIDYFFSKNVFILAKAGMVILFAMNFYFFWKIYTVHFLLHSAESFQYGYKQMAEYINKHYDSYDRFVVNNLYGEYDEFVGVPHLYLAYFNKVDPRSLQNRIIKKDGLYYDKYRITGIDFERETFLPKTFYFTSVANLPNKNISKNLNKVTEIRYPDGIVKFVGYETK